MVTFGSKSSLTISTGRISTCSSLMTLSTSRKSVLDGCPATPTRIGPRPFDDEVTFAGTHLQHVGITSEGQLFEIGDLFARVHLAERRKRIPRKRKETRLSLALPQ